jgi:DNA-binding MarR family transcriptional regulator
MTSLTGPDADAPQDDRPDGGVTTLEAVRALARASRLLERASSELSLAHYRVLAAIASGDERATRIAARLAIGKPAISAAVESLCQRGLLDRSEVAGDQRAAALHLTAQGRAVLDRVETEMTTRLDRLCERVPNPGQMLEALVWLDAAIEAELADFVAERAAQR